MNKVDSVSNKIIKQENKIVGKLESEASCPEVSADAES